MSNPVQAVKARLKAQLDSERRQAEAVLKARESELEALARKEVESAETLATELEKQAQAQRDIADAKRLRTAGLNAPVRVPDVATRKALCAELNIGRGAVRRASDSASFSLFFDEVDDPTKPTLVEGRGVVGPASHDLRVALRGLVALKQQADAVRALADEQEAERQRQAALRSIAEQALSEEDALARFIEDKETVEKMEGTR